MSDVRVALMSAPDEETAGRIVRILVEERLAACGNIVAGSRSIYRWQGAVEEAAEVLVVLKTTQSAAPTMIRRVAEMHPYDVPEVLVLDVSTGLVSYMEWVRACVDDGEGE
ncbi:MAG: divalent-cation tolerance protein CutA [Gemmatimonadota bacterium]